ncbi:protein snail-like [Eriocheir sinensis]|uniref:protein snail-like n=1 Tax=Eriocheir sinensis TaxID=95602 RepID=UPI0021C8E70C|nr:protein snail-like [Eriocheir sinensis]
MTTAGKEHIARPPKKRPLALFNYLLESSRGGEDDENLQPEDLSMKSSRRPSTPPPRPATPSFPSPSPSLMTPSPLLTTAPAAPSLTPRRPAVTTLLGLVGGGLGVASALPHTTSITHASEGSGRPFYSSSNNGSSNSSNSSSGVITSSSYTGSTLSPGSGSGSSFMSSAGLRLISEVAAACGRPTVLRTPGSSAGTHSSPYAPPTPRDPLRHVLRERGVGVRSWPYHPYLPLGVYGLPSPLQAVHTPTSVRNESASPASRPRGGSVSPPGEAGSSSSESSPEAQQDGRGPRLTCPDCGRRYATMAGLAKHRQFHCLKDAGRSFACKHCDKVYTSLGALKMHIRTHTLPCKCQLCGKAFSRPWLLQGHIRTHTGEKPFQCPQCDRCFADRSNLRAHLQTHTDVKKYACRTCPKTFSRTSLLVKHEDHGCPGVRPARPMALAPAASLPI